MRPPSRGVSLLELLQLERDVGDRRVDLAGQEVPLAVRREELRERAIGPREELDHHEERHDPRVGLREVAEVVVRGDLAAEQRILLAHPVLDERVSDAVDQRQPPASSIARGTAQLARTS